MIIPPILELCAAVPELVARLSDNVGLKVSEFDTTRTVTAPYCVWQLVTASPAQYLDSGSDMDSVAVQVDIYAANKSDARQIAALLRAAIQEDCYITSYRGLDRDPSTNLYRISIDTSWQLEP